MEGNLGIENLGKWTESKESHFTKRVQEMGERISDVQGTLEAMDALVKTMLNIKNSYHKISRKSWTLWKDQT